MLKDNVPLSECTLHMLSTETSGNHTSVLWGVALPGGPGIVGCDTTRWSLYCGVWYYQVVLVLWGVVLPGGPCIVGCGTTRWSLYCGVWYGTNHLKVANSYRLHADDTFRKRYV